MTIRSQFTSDMSAADAMETLNDLLTRVSTVALAVADLQTPKLYFTAATVSVTEGNDGAKAVVYTMGRSKTTGALAVTTTFIAGTANASDFPGNALPGNLIFNFADGAATATASDFVQGDLDVEEAETFGRQIVAPSGYAVGTPATVTVTILNDDVTVQPITINPQTAAYSDSFVGDGQLAARPNWIIPAGEEDRWITTAGSLQFNKTFDGTRRAIFAANNLSGDLDIELEYDSSMDGPDKDAGEFELRTDFNLCYVDENNYLRVNHGGGLFDGVGVRGIINGVQGSGYVFRRPAESPARTKGVLRFVIAKGVMRVAFDGVWSKSVSQNQNWPFDRITMANSGMPNPVQSGRFAVQANTWRYNRMAGVAVYAGQMTLDVDDEFVGRDSATATGGTWTGSGTYTGFTYSSAAVRIRDFKTGAVVSDWAPPKAINALNGAYTAGAFLPLGGPYIVDLALKGTDGIDRIRQSRPVLSGYHVLYYGQSNSLGRGNVYDAAVKGDRYASYVNPGASQNGNFPAGHWASTLTDYRGTPAMGTGRTAAPLLNVPVAMTAGGTNGVSLSALIPGAIGWTALLELLAPLKGIIELVIFDQGEGDADGSDLPADYVGMFRDQLLPALRTRANNPNMKVLLAEIGSYPGGGVPNDFVGSMAKWNSQRDAVRQYHQTLVDTVPGVSYASFKLGANHGDDAYHYRADQYDVLMGYRDGQSVAKALGASTYDGRGPLVTGVGRNGAAITLTIDRNGADTLSGPVTYDTFTGTYGTPPANSFAGYEVSADNFATNLPISGIAVSGSNLVITLASAPSGPVKVRSFAGGNYDDRSLYVGNYTGGLTIPVAPIIKPLTTA